MSNRRSSEPILNAPPVVLLLCASLMITHAVRLALPQALGDRLVDYGAIIPGAFWNAGNPNSYDSYLWAAGTLVSHAFLHADWGHVIMNTLTLLIAGAPVHRYLNAGVSGTRRRGTERFLLIFFLSAIFGGLTHLVTAYPDGAAAVGASGGVSGLIAGAIMIMQGPGRGVPAALLSRKFLMVSGGFVILNVLMAFAGPELLGGGIAWEAHIGGYIAGALLFRFFTYRQFT